MTTFFLSNSQKLWITWKNTTDTKNPPACANCQNLNAKLGVFDIEAKKMPVPQTPTATLNRAHSLWSFFSEFFAMNMARP